MFNRTPKAQKGPETAQEAMARRNGKVALICGVAFFGMVGAAICIAALELWQYYRRSAVKADTITDTAFWAYGMAFGTAVWFLPSVIILGGAWMGLVWYMSK